MRERHPREFSPHSFGGGARTLCGFTIACSRFCVFGRGRHGVTQIREARLKLHQFVGPALQFARGERHINREPPRRQLDVALRLLALPGEGAHLTLHFLDQVVEPRQIDRRLFKPPFGAATAITVQADAGCLLKQFPPLVGPIAEQSINHLRFDHDATVGAEAGAAHQVVNVTQTTGDAIQEIVALAGTGQPARDDDFPERHRQYAVGVIEIQ